MKIRKIVSRSRTPLVVPFCHNTHIRQFKKVHRQCGYVLCVSLSATYLHWNNSLLVRFALHFLPKLKSSAVHDHNSAKTALLP